MNSMLNELISFPYFHHIERKKEKKFAELSDSNNTDILWPITKIFQVIWHLIMP